MRVRAVTTCAVVPRVPQRARAEIIRDNLSRAIVVIFVVISSECMEKILRVLGHHPSAFVDDAYPRVLLFVMKPQCSRSSRILCLNVS